tara:strand:- start:69 stop:731 length:663 start_codon:yes stop_codon:yes gene_type:complete
MSQFTLNLENKPALGRNDFIVSESNLDAIRWIDNWPYWSHNSSGLNVVGPKSSGKTHLGSVWCSLSEAKWVNAPITDGMRVPDILKNGQNIVLDNFDHTWPGVPLLHLYNLVKERKGFMFIISNIPVAQLGIAPDDLASRLCTMPVVAIKPPDDFLLKEVMLKLFKDRQIAVENGVVDFLVVRMERSFEEALRLVNLLDKEALAEKNRITIPLASRVLQK